MFTKKGIRVILIAAIMLLAINVGPGSAEKLSLGPQPAPAVDPTDMGTAFTYQGRLMSGTSPASGVYDFEFKLYDDASAGTLIGTDYLDDYTVTGGLFMAPLDFGAGAFTGFERWLEIGVKPDASVSYTTLSPRQQINPAPYATFARTIYRKTVVVKPVGTAYQNGTVLLNALASISGAGATNPYLVKIEPGIYNIGSSSLVMQPYVDIEGSGEAVTRIESTGFSTSLTGTVIGSGNAELRSLTIRSDGGGVSSYAVAMFNNAVSPTLTHTTLEASNSAPGKNNQVYGMRNMGGSFATFHSVTVKAQSSGCSATGIENNSSSLEISESNIAVISDYSGTGIYNNTYADLTVLDSQVVTMASGEGGASTIAIVTQYYDTLLMRNSRLEVTGNTHGYAIGVFSQIASFLQIFDSTVDVENGDPFTFGFDMEDNNGLEMTNTTVLAHGGPNNNIGIFAHDTPLTIRDSQVAAEGTPSNIAIQIDDLDLAPVHEITRTYIRASSPGDATHTNYQGVNILSDGRVKFYRDTIEVEPFIMSPTGSPLGGTGIFNDGGTVTFENSTINSVDEEAFIGIQHIYYTLPGTFNMLYVNNSEIYTCKVEPTLCNTILAGLGGGTGFQQPFVYVGSSLLWGGNVNPGLPNISCMWVHDENFNGFGWPVMGPVPANPACP